LDEELGSRLTQLKRSRREIVDLRAGFFKKKREREAEGEQGFQRNPRYIAEEFTE
jgi:hypothetical protein